MNRIRRGLEKAKIQEELMQHEQKLSRAERRFQVRRPISYFFFIAACDWAEWDQLSSSIEMRYVLGVPSAASSNTPPRIPDQDQDVTTNTIGSPGASSSLGWSPFDSPVTRSEVVMRSCGHVGSSLPFLVIIEAHADALELRSGSPLPANAVYTEEEEFLANMSGDTDEFGVRSCCFDPRCPGSPIFSFAIITNRMSSL
jgi:hypothetical protein